MADNNFRSYRGRDAGAPPRSQPDDPLAELARLIGQSEPATDYDRDAQGGPSFDQPARDLDWAAEDRYAQPREPAEADYDAPDERYAPAQHADLLPTFRPGAPSYDDAHEPPASRPFSPPARSLNGARDYALPERARFPDEQQPVQSVGRQPPGFLSQLPDDRDYDYPPEQGADDQAYALEDYEEEAPAGRRRTGLVVVAAVLGLAVLGTAGAFAYRAMFGSSMLPSLPPIIKADDGPNKIVPNKPKSNASDQADASATSGEKLVSREEQPVDVPAPANSAPAGGVDDPDFPRSEFRSGRHSEFCARGRAGIRAERLSRRPLRHPQHRCKQTQRQPRRPGPYGRRPRAPRLHPLAARRRLGRARRYRPRRKRFTRSSSEPIRWGRRRPMPRPRRRRRQLRQPRHPSGLRLVPLCSRSGRRPRRELRPMARCRSFPIRTALRRPLHAPAPRWRVRPSPVRRNEPNRRHRPPPAAMPFKSRLNAARLMLRRSFGHCGPNFPPSSAAVSRSSDGPILAPKAFTTARWSAPLPQRTKRQGCVRA